MWSAETENRTQVYTVTTCCTNHYTISARTHNEVTSRICKHVCLMSGLDTSPQVYCMSRRPETENCTILQFWAKAIFRDFPWQSAGCLPDGLQFVRLYDCTKLLCVVGLIYTTCICRPLRCTLHSSWLDYLSSITVLTMWLLINDYRRSRFDTLVVACLCAYKL